MLTAAAVGLAAYGTYSAGLGVVALFGGVSLDWWAAASLILFGLVLLVSAPLVRVRFPGSVALAAGALLALQALALHNDFHFYGRIVPPFQAARGVYAALLVLLAAAGRGVPDTLPDEDARPEGGHSSAGPPLPRS